MNSRIEKDLLGERTIANEHYFGIHTLRAIENFSLSAPSVNLRLVYGLALVKKAAALTNEQLGQLEPQKAQAIVQACDEIAAGKLDQQFPVNSLQGGAGTSTNMNVNECIANRALELLGREKGDYDHIHPLNHVNLCQSTNDTYPTALRIAAIRLVRNLSQNLAQLQEMLQQKEEEFSQIMRLGRTQLMDAVPMGVGQGFGAYAQTIARDRWRIYKAEERLRSINMGGTAIGTGLNAPLKYIFLVTEQLQSLTGLGLARAESPMDVTQNADVYVEVSGLLKACAVNLLKISSDLRLLASGPGGGIGELILPEVQAGSTIMPGKVNPVILEMVGQVAMKVIANDGAITYGASMGQLELNGFLPLIGESLLNSLELLTEAVGILNEKCIAGLKVDEKRCAENLEDSSAFAAGLIEHIGYDQAAILAKKARTLGLTLKQVALQEKVLPADRLERIFSIREMTRPGIPGK